MSSTFSESLRLELMADAENEGTWGQKTNINLGTLLESAIAGVASITMSDANKTLTTADGADDEARHAVLVISGTLTANRDVIIPAVSKVYIVKNSTTGGFSLNVKTASGVAAEVRNGTTSMVFCDGVNVYSGSTAGSQTYTSGTAQTFPKPSNAATLKVEMWGGGGSGGWGGSGNGGGGGGGGAYSSLILPLSKISGDITYTVGAGGAARASYGVGNIGGTTSITLTIDGTSKTFYAYGGGGGGVGASGNGGGGGAGNSGSGGSASGATAGAAGLYDGGAGNGGGSYYGGAGGGKAGGAGSAGGNSVYGGAGGGGCVSGAGGTSTHGGNGGTGGTLNNTTPPTEGTSPGGGGGGSEDGNSGAGGSGKIIFTWW